MGILKTAGRRPHAPHCRRPDLLRLSRDEIKVKKTETVTLIRSYTGLDAFGFSQRFLREKWHVLISWSSLSSFGSQQVCTSCVLLLKLHTCNTMGLLDLMLPWITRAAVLVSVVLLTLTTLRRHSDIPLSQATLRVAHLCSFRCTSVPAE